MSSSAIPITQKLLVNAGGWDAMKSAQQLHRSGRVSESSYEPPLLSGIVQEGNRRLRSGLRIKSAADVENICTCRESREWGKICAHSLAVGLAYLEKLATPEESPVAPVPKVEKPAGPRFAESGTENAVPVALHFILPPHFQSGWAKGQIMLVTEVELRGRRAMPTALSTDETYAGDNHDLSALDGLGELAAMRMFSREEFLRLLTCLRGHPRVSFGKDRAAKIMTEAHRPRLRLSGKPAEAISIQVETDDGDHLLMAGEEAWILRGSSFSPLTGDLPAELRALSEGAITLRGASAQEFLAFTAPRLSEWFVVTSEFALPEFRTVTPKIVLKLEGSMRELHAELRAQYADGAHAIGGADPMESRFVHDAAGSAFLLRDIRAEERAIAHLETLGFTARSERWLLGDENRVARFLAFELPRLKTEWDVHLAAPTAKATEELEPLSPKLEVIGSGEDWFELRYSLGTPGGELFSASELQRLLRSGQSKKRLKNGRTAVFDPAAITDFEEVLRDCDPRQSQPGTYRFKRTQAPYVALTAQELGTALRGLSEEKAAARPALGDLEDKLREYQREGVAWLARLAQNKLGGILADEMGLGKTVQALAFLRAQKASEPALIVCPTSLLTNWENEAQRFTPELRLLLLEGPKRHSRFPGIKDADLVLTSYAILQRDAEKYRAFQFSTVILDEAQHIKNPDTQNAQAAFALRARHRFVLTGTPLENSVRDLWSLMNFVLPGYLGTRADFRERYEQPLARGAAPEIQRRLARRMRPFLLRRRKTEVAKDLPEKIEQRLMCDLNPAQRAAYDGLLREIQSGLTSGREKNETARRMRMLVGLLRLRQACCDLRLLGGEEAASAKLELLDELMEEAIDGGHRVLIFSQFVAMLKLLGAHLSAQKIRFAYLDGQTRERQAVVDEFQNDAAIPVFLMSLKAGGVGLNLSAADTVIHFDPWWNFAAEAQATDRAHRIGQKRIVTAYKLIARDTVEEKIVKLQSRKRDVSEALIGSEEPLMSGLTTEDLEELLR